MRGLALEGGGAKGAYHIGAYKALIKNGYKFKCIAGTSIGAVNAALICQGDFKKLEELWNNIDPSIFNMDESVVDALINKKNVFKHSFKTITSILKSKGIDTTNFLNLLNQYVDENRVRKSKIKFGLVTMRVKDFMPLELTIDEIPNGKLIEYIMASCYLPVFNMKKIIDDSFYLDGGFTNVLPITLLERMGCNEIIGIRVKKFGLIKKKKNINTKVTIIKPKKNIGSVILLNKKRIEKNAKLGFFDTLKVIKKLDGNTYYLKRHSLLFYKYIGRKIKKDELMKLCKKYNVTNIKDLTIKLLEKIMKENNYEVLEYYDSWKVIKEIKKKYNKSKDMFALNYIYRIKNY